MSQENVVDIVCERIQFDLDKLKSNELEKIEVDSFNLSDFWKQFEAAVQGLSNEVTKIGFACGQQPFPTSGVLAAMLQDLVQCYSVTRDLYLVLPEEVGDTVYRATTSAVVNIVAALLAVVRTLSDLSVKGAKERLVLTATFWEACSAVDSLPRNNLLATLGVLEAEAGLATDAQEELTQTIEEDREARSEQSGEDNSELWTEPERELATKAVGLVKVTQVCVQRVQKAVADHGSCSSQQNCAELDATAAASRSISPALDDFVSELYHPVDVPKAVENVQRPPEEGNSRPERTRHYKDEEVPDYLLERFRRLDACGWTSKQKRNRRWCVYRKDGTRFRVRSWNLRQLCLDRPKQH